ncbi:MAG: hypothetical protein ACOCSF_03780 [Halanaeroarchaeum sp.]
MRSMGFRGWVLIVAAMLVLSGCLVDPVDSGGVDPEGRLDNIPRADPGPIPTEDGDSDLTVEPSDFNVTVAVPDRSPAVDEDLPVEDPARSIATRTVQVVVGVENESENARNWTALVSPAVAYWEENAERYVSYSVEFDLDPGAEDPDVLVSFQDTVDCRGETGWLGCAPDVESIDRSTEPMVVSIKSGYTNESTVRTIKHEFGHLLGLDHGEDPMPLMSARQESLALAQQNATSRAFPWRDRNLSVHVDYGSLSPDRQIDAANQVSRALEYYQRRVNSSKWGNVSFTPTRDSEAADVRIDFDSDSPLLQGAGSIGRPKGPDVDGDERVEYYTESRIVVSNVQTEAIGWHVGYWLGVSLGATNESELPEPFRNDTRTDEWWR